MKYMGGVASLETSVLRIFNDANDLTVLSEYLANRILTWKSSSSQRLIDDARARGVPIKSWRSNLRPAQLA